VNNGNYDPISEDIMTLPEHTIRELALDLYVYNKYRNRNWGKFKNLSLKNIFQSRDKTDEVGFWGYKKIINIYHSFLPHFSLFLNKKLPHQLAKNYQLIANDITPSVNNMFKKIIAESTIALQGYLNAVK
jgi:hypothetical protein